MAMTTDTPSTASANPFASRYIDALPFRMPYAEVGELCMRLEALGGRAAIVGPHGTGKTTLLERLGDELAGAGWTVHRYRTTEQNRGICDMTSRPYCSGDAVLIDGAGHLRPLLQRRLLRHMNGAGRLITTEHRDGRLPCLHRCDTSLALLDDLVMELAPAIAQEVRPHAHALYTRYGGNIRDVLRGLYDHCAGLA